MLSYKIYTYEGLYLEGNCYSINFKTIEGEMTVYNGHIPLCVQLQTSALKINSDNIVKTYAINQGILTLSNNKIIILTQSIEDSDSIDLQRALNQKQKAEQLLFSTKDKFYIDKAEMDLKRAINRINIAKK